MSHPIMIQKGTIYLENEIIENGHLLLVNGKIAEISTEPIKPSIENVHIIHGEGYAVIPGFIDNHIHGAKGADTMDATTEALDIMSSALPGEGTTAFLATTITQSKENIEAALQNVAMYHNKDGHAELIGIHLEGPFINKIKKGAQPEQFIMDTNIALFKTWQKLAEGKIKTVTLAPECDHDGLIPYLVAHGCTVSAGHTEANFAQIKEAVDNGVLQLTHLCNAMTGIHHRDIGAVGAAFILPALLAEVIADEIHLSPQMLQLIFDQMGAERIILITDSIRAKSLGDGNVDLGGQTVTVKNNRAVLHDGTLAGSILKMIEAVKNMMKLDGVSLTDIIQMASINPAKQLNIFDEKGSIAVGKDADILLINQDITIKYTICKGVVAYKGEDYEHHPSEK